MVNKEMTLSEYEKEFWSDEETHGARGFVVLSHPGHDTRCESRDGRTLKYAHLAGERDFDRWLGHRFTSCYVESGVAGESAAFACWRTRSLDGRPPAYCGPGVPFERDVEPVVLVVGYASEEV